MKLWRHAVITGTLALASLLHASLLLAQQSGGAAGVPSPPAFSSTAANGPFVGWRPAGLPKQTLPETQFDLVSLEGRQVLRVRTEASYGTLVHDRQGERLGPEALLRWSWRLERGLPNSDLSRREGDDSALKVCALFDMPLDGMSFVERSKLRLARALSGEFLPGATLCYVWDRLLPVGSALANAHSERVRFLVLSSGPARPGQWQQFERRLAADFMAAFGHETRSLPPLIALLIGADADNSKGSSLAYVGDLVLQP